MDAINELKLIDEFRKVLANYQVSENAKQTLARLKLVLLVGPSSSGRNTIINELLKSGKYHFITSDTTRQPRINNGVLEEHGREYWFRSEEEILHDLQAGEFLEAAIIHNQQVSGISMRELAAAADEGRIAINEIEVVGADNIHEASPSALFFFVLPPSFDEWMARRDLRGRLPMDEVRRRLESSVVELTTGLQRDYYRFIVNDTFTHAAKRIDQMIDDDYIDPEYQAQAKELAAEILADTKKYLANLG